MIDAEDLQGETSWVKDPVSGQISNVTPEKAAELYNKGYTAPSLQDLTDAGRIDNTGNLVPLPDKTVPLTIIENPLTTVDNRDVTIGDIKPDTLIQQPPSDVSGRYGNFNAMLFNPKTNQTVSIQDPKLADALIKTGFWKAPEVDYDEEGNISLRHPEGTIPFAISKPGISLPPGVKPGTELILPTGYEKVFITKGTPDQGNMIKLASGEFVDAVSYYKISPDEQDRLNELGVDKFNQLAGVNASINEYEVMQNALITQSGMEPYNIVDDKGNIIKVVTVDDIASGREPKRTDWKPKLITIFAPSIETVDSDFHELPNGEYVAKEGTPEIPGWNQLSPEDQEKLSILGIERFNELLKLRKASLDSETTALIDANRAALIAINPYGNYSGEDVVYNIDKYLQDNGNSLAAVKTLRDANFTYEDIQQAIMRNKLSAIESDTRRVALGLLQPYADYTRPATGSKGVLSLSSVEPTYNIPLFLRKNQDNPQQAIQTLQDAGFNNYSINQSMRINSDYYGVGGLTADQRPIEEDYITKYFKDNNWAQDVRVPVRGMGVSEFEYAVLSRKYESYIEHLRQAQASYYQLYQPKLTIEQFIKQYVNERGFDYLGSRNLLNVSTDFFFGAEEGKTPEYIQIREEAINRYKELYGEDKTRLSDFAELSSFVFAPSKALDPALREEDITTFDYIIGAVQIAAYTSPIWIGSAKRILGAIEDRTVPFLQGVDLPYLELDKTAKLARAAGQARQSMQQSVTGLSNLPGAETASDALELVYKSKVADKAFIDNLSGLANIDKAYLARIEKLYGRPGLQSNINNISTISKALKKAWDIADNYTWGTPEYIAQLQSISALQAQLDDALVTFGKITTIQADAIIGQPTGYIAKQTTTDYGKYVMELADKIYRSKQDLSVAEMVGDKQSATTIQSDINRMQSILDNLDNTIGQQQVIDQINMQRNLVASQGIDDLRKYGMGLLDNPSYTNLTASQLFNEIDDFLGKPGNIVTGGDGRPIDPDLLSSIRQSAAETKTKLAKLEQEEWEKNVLFKSTETTIPGTQTATEVLTKTATETVPTPEVIEGVSVSAVPKVDTTFTDLDRIAVGYVGRGNVQTTTDVSRMTPEQAARYRTDTARQVVRATGIPLPEQITAQSIQEWSTQVGNQVITQYITNTENLSATQIQSMTSDLTKAMVLEIVSSQNMPDNITQSQVNDLVEQSVKQDTKTGTITGTTVVTEPGTRTGTQTRAQVSPGSKPYPITQSIPAVKTSLESIEFKPIIKFIKKEDEEEEKNEKLGISKGAIAWKQGTFKGSSVWYVIKYPYKTKKDVTRYIGQLPPGVKDVMPGKYSAIRSIQQIYGKPAKQIELDLGIMDIDIYNGNRIDYSKDSYQKTNHGINLKGVKQIGIVRSKPKRKQRKTTPGIVLW